MAATTTAARQAAYLARQASQGFHRHCVFIPAGCNFELEQFARALQAGDVIQGLVVRKRNGQLRTIPLTSY